MLCERLDVNCFVISCYDLLNILATSEVHFQVLETSSYKHNNYWCVRKHLPATEALWLFYERTKD